MNLKWSKKQAKQTKKDHDLKVDKIWFCFKNHSV